MTYSTHGIVLRREPWRETARLYTIFTRETGKVLAVGRGTRKVLSKLGPHLEPFSSVELLLARGRKTEVICGAILARSPEALAADERRYLAASFVSEAVDHFVKMGERDEELWDLIEAAYGDLASLPSDRIGDGLTGFLWEFMAHLGYRPKLDACDACGRPFSREPLRFLPILGTAICRTCVLDERSLSGAVIMPADAPSPLAALSFLEARLDRPLNSFAHLRESAMMGANHSLLSYDGFVQ